MNTDAIRMKSRKMILMELFAGQQWRPRGFPDGASGKKPACQCRRCRFNPWTRKISWRRSWEPTPVFLPGESRGQRSLTGYNPRGPKESDMAEMTSHKREAQT